MRQALEYTLSQLQPDGAFARGPEVQGTHREGRLVTAAYVQEGWMAADALLPNDPEILPRLRAALPAHVDWVLKNQQPDGRWHEVEGEFARTPAIVDFLIWYDQRCEVRPEVREAIGRAARLFADIERRDELELYIHGNHHEVQRAIAGRTIAALGSERFVP